MANVNLKITKPIEVLNTDTELVIANKAGKLGSLKVSRGGVEWWPRGNSANAHKCTWEKLAAVLEEHVPMKRVKKPAAAKKKAAAK